MKHVHHDHCNHEDQPCSCGQDHGEHNKLQDHHKLEEDPCSCGHEHSEDHHPVKHFDEDIAITHHENAVIVSAEREISGDYTRVKEALTLGLKDLADWVKSQNGLVGHIKAHLSEKG